MSGGTQGMGGRDPRAGRVVVLTGAGKGKSSSAFGMVLRAAGWGMKVCVIQFIKGERRTGEQVAAQRLGVAWHALGDGFTWDTNNPQRDRETTRRIWDFARERVANGGFDLVVLDEVNYCCGYGWLSGAEVAAFIRAEKPPRLHLVLTGRNAPPEVVAVADTVTEMVAVKHGHEQGLPARKGVEF